MYLSIIGPEPCPKHNAAQSPRATRGIRVCGITSARIRRTKMSVQAQLKRITVPEIRAHKGGAPIVCLTCYHAHTARLLDNHVDLMLVGDSLGMVMHGLETTLGVTLEM